MRGFPIFLTGVLVAASFLIARFVEIPQPIGPFWKAAGIALLGVFALSRGARLAAFGLLASSVGDFVLDLDPPIWIGGMAAFGIAHIFYALAFLENLRTQGRAAFGPFFAALSVILSVGMFIWLLPGMEALFAPGLVYHAVITVMVALALLSRAPLAARAGALLFLASDAVIALELYKGLGPFGPLNWLLYAPAQMLIAWGLSADGRSAAVARA
jgi:uncharacterized membrane protein YhhN